MDDIDLLSGVLDKTGDVIARVRPEQRALPTPCPQYDVATLVDHLVGWLHVFDAGCNDRTFEGDPSTFRCGDDPSAEYRATAASLIDGWRRLGTDRGVRTLGGETPAPMVINMTLMEEMTHGWDLATATSQPIPYGDDEAAAVFERATATLPPQYQGEGMPFGAIVPVPDEAPAIDRLIGFLGRTP